MGSFPYHSHIFRDSYGSGMGIVWEASHKGVPLLGVPENPIDVSFQGSRSFHNGLQESLASRVRLSGPILYLSHTIHGTGIFTYMNGCF